DLKKFASGQVNLVDIGSMDVTGGDLRTAPNLSGLVPTLRTPTLNPLTQLTDEQKQFVADADTSIDSGGAGFQLPLLTAPKTLFTLLRGRDVALFTLPLPKLGVEPRSPQAFSVFPPFLTIVLDGRIGMSGQLSFGYDTFGLRQA